MLFLHIKNALQVLIEKIQVMRSGLKIASMRTETKNQKDKTDEIKRTFRSEGLGDKMAISKKMGERILKAFGNSKDYELKAHRV